MNFGEILSKAWKIIWRYKILWIFGIFTSCGQGNGGNGGYGANAVIQYSGGKGDFPPGMQNYFNNIESFFESIQAWQIAALIIGSILISLILIFIFTALRTIGRVGLIQGTVKGKDTIEGESASGMTFRTLFNSVKPFFWRIFGFNILSGIAVFILGFSLIIPIIAFAIFTLGIGLLCLVPLICLLIPIGWLVSVLFEQVNIAIVVEDLNILDGLKRSWEILRDNIGNLIIMGLILLLGGGLISVILALPMISIGLPLIVGMMRSVNTGSDFFLSGGIIASALCCAAYVPVLVILRGILQAFIKTAWTLTYLDITHYEPPATEIFEQPNEENDPLSEYPSEGSE